MGKKTLYVLSYGLKPGHLTWEAAGALRTCGRVFSYCVDGKMAGRIPAPLRGLKRVSGHSFAAARNAVLEAFGEHDTVGLLIYGNP